MEEKDILNGGLNELDTMKSELQGKISVCEEIKKLKAEVDRYERNLKSEEKSVQNLVNESVGKARNEIVKRHDKDINHEKMNIKEQKDKKAKEKAKGVKKRIESETESYVEDNKRIKKEIRDRFKERGIPGYCNSNWFYALFMPKGILDITIFVLFAILTIVGIPLLLSFIIADKWWTRAIVYILVLLVESAVYITIYLLTRDKDKYILEEMRENRNSIKENSAKIRQIKRSIKKDTDESMYNLQDFDNKIKAFEQNVSDLITKKNEELQDFDNNIKPQIINDVINSNQERIDSAKSEVENSKSALSDSEQKLKDINESIEEKYAKYLGKDMTSIQMVDKMRALIEEGQATNINEAINKIRGNNI